jgi:hypothetical protein
MAISKIKTGSIEDGTLSTADLADSSITSAKIAANPEFSGTEAAKMPTGTTGQRANAASGDIRFNTTLSLMEYYDGTNWKSIDSPPVINSVSGAINENTDSTLTVNGSNFQTGAVVYVEGAAVSNTSRALTTTFVNASQVTAATNATAVNYVGGGSYDIKLINASGLSAISAAAGAVDRDPTWTTSSGSIGNIYDISRGSVSLSVTATDADSNAVTYAVTTGSLPSGLSLNSSTGAITGATSGVGSDTTTTFSITPTANGQAGVARSFSITQKAPVIVSFTSTGSSTFSVPTGLTSLRVMLVAGGGGSGRYGAGGAGGMIEMSSFPVTPAGTVSYTVGSGGTAGDLDGAFSGGTGIDSVFGSLTAKGGGGGKYHSSSGGPATLQPGSNGGSGAGGDSNPGSAPNASGGTGNQPAQPGNSGTYGYGNPGTVGGNFTSGNGGNVYVGGGGGGAGGVGPGYTTTGDGSASPGGIGRASDISGSSTYYAGGGGGSYYNNINNNSGSGGLGGGGRGATNLASTGRQDATNGTPNTGGGGGGGGMAGGPGIIIVKY